MATGDVPGRLPGSHPPGLGKAFLRGFTVIVLMLVILGSGMFFFFHLFAYAFQLLDPGSTDPGEASGWHALLWLLIALGATVILSHSSFHENFGSMWLLYGINTFLRIFLMAFLMLGMILGGMFSFFGFLYMLLEKEYDIFPWLVALVAMSLGMYFVFTKVNRLRLPFEPPGR